MTDRALADRYTLGERLGSGGMAEVYRATDRVLGREVAVKVLHPRFARDRTYVARFRREARAAAALNHRNVVAVYDSGEDDGTKFIVMEHVRGRTLKDVIGDEGPLPAERAARIAAAVCEGLAAAHARGLVHRDIKPANIMLTDEGDAKVMDFGIARGTTADTLTATATVMGTAAYISPEQARGQAVDTRSDLYSLGCVLYEMLTGLPPFSSDNPVAVAARHVRDTPQPISERSPEVPPHVAEATMRALEKDPDRRFADAVEMRRVLLGRAESPTVPIPPRGGDTAVLPVQGPAPPPRRGRFLALLVTLALVGFLATWAARSGGVNAPPSGDTDGQTEDPAPPEMPADPSPQQAYLALLALVGEGLEAGEVSPGAAGSIEDRASRAIGALRDGDLGKALDEAAKLRGEVTGRVPDEIHPARAEALLGTADALEAAIREQAPGEVEEDVEDEDEDDDTSGDTGRGSGSGRGPPGGAPPGQP